MGCDEQLASESVRLVRVLADMDCVRRAASELLAVAGTTEAAVVEAGAEVAVVEAPVCEREKKRKKADEVVRERDGDGDALEGDDVNGRSAPSGVKVPLARHFFLERALVICAPSATRVGEADVAEGVVVALALVAGEVAAAAVVAGVAVAETEEEEEEEELFAWGGGGGEGLAVFGSGGGRNLSACRGERRLCSAAVGECSGERCGEAAPCGSSGANGEPGRESKSKVNEVDEPPVCSCANVSALAEWCAMRASSSSSSYSSSSSSSSSSSWLWRRWSSSSSTNERGSKASSWWGVAKAFCVRGVYSTVRGVQSPHAPPPPLRIASMRSDELSDELADRASISPQERYLGSLRLSSERARTPTNAHTHNEQIGITTAAAAAKGVIAAADIRD